VILITNRWEHCLVFGSCKIETRRNFWRCQSKSPSGCDQKRGRHHDRNARPFVGFNATGPITRFKPLN